MGSGPPSKCVGRCDEAVKQEVEMAHGGGGEGETLDDDEEDEKEDELGRSDGCRR